MISAVSNPDKLQPFSQWQEVTVTFGPADTDTVVPHQLQPPSAEMVNYATIRAGGEAVVYHDTSGTRTPWQSNYIILRSTIPNCQVSLLLYVSQTPAVSPIVTVSTRPANRLLGRTNTLFTAGNSAAAVTIFSQVISPQELQAVRMLRYGLTGAYVNTSGGASNVSLIISYGGTNLIAGVIAALGNNTTGPLSAWALLNARTTQLQESNVCVDLPPSGVALAGAAPGLLTRYGAYQNLTVDSTVAQTFQVQIQHGVANANINFFALAQTLELLG